MPTTIHSSFVLIIWFLFLRFALTYSQNQFNPIRDVLNSHKAEITYQKSPTFNGECFLFHFRNKSNDTLFVDLESGQNLGNEYPEMFIVKSQELMVLPHQQIENAGYAFYYENPTSSILDDTKQQNELTPEKWKKLARTINANEFTIEAIQAAIWCITDNHPLHSIPTKGNQNIQALKRTVSEIQKNEFPWYYLRITDDTTTLNNTKQINLIGNISFYVESSSIITVNIRNNSNEVMTTLIEQTSVGPGTHKFSLNTNVSLWPKGNYVIYVYQDFSQILTRETFEL